MRRQSFFACFPVFSSSLIVIVWMLGVMPAIAPAAMLGIPGPRSTLSGIGVISGWKCEAGDLTIRFNGGPPIPLLHGAERKDVLDAGACRHANAGFVTIMNWGNLGDGSHTAVAYDDGVEFARSRFRVVTPRYAMTPPHVQGECISDDFPEPGDQSRFVWNPTTQHMELAEVWQWHDETDSPRLPGSADFDFLLDRWTWTIEVPDLLLWQTISQHENPEWPRLDPDNGGRGGNRYVAAEVQFIRYVHGGTSNKIYPFSIPPPWGINLVGEIQGTIVSHLDRRGRVVLRPALPNFIEVGTLANGLLLQTREAIGELGEGYSMVLPMNSPGTTQGNRCFILVFDKFHRTADGGLEALARFYMTAYTPHVQGEPRYCVPPIYPSGIGSSYSVPSVTEPHETTRLLIY